MTECIQHGGPLSGPYCGPDCQRLTREWQEGCGCTYHCCAGLCCPDECTCGEFCDGELV